MIEDITMNPERTDRGTQQLQRDGLLKEKKAEQAQARQMQQHQAEGVKCPHCGAINDAEATFCASCGNPLRMMPCPHCGNEMEPDADFCEVCHRYIRHDVCSFCGAHLMSSDAFCPQCGNPQGGIVCPTCNTLNDFSFCKQCGTPLTEEAKALVKELKMQPDYQMLVEAASELQELNKQIPFMSERDIIRSQMNDKLRERVLLLLAKDKGITNPTIPSKESKRMTRDELQKKKNEKIDQITALLDRMAIPQLASPIKARNYAMAQKPAGVRLAWVCNWKHAMHSSPCGCAKPQLGGKWVILGKNSNNEIKDDKK